MNEGAQHQPASNSPDTASSEEPVVYGYCTWHCGYSADIRVINVDEQGSGPGGVQSACLPCREKHDLIPYSERP
ncbi:hypothetical protein [Streptomyces sp. NPDC047070]|uniref:hypothetical protein n=1 Tax=Streptomyces sp. NPDC047070 TaxID=3154923 RepID=UPI003453590F